MKAFGLVGIMAIVLATVFCVSPAAAVTYNLTLTGQPNSAPGISGSLVYSPAGQADDTLAAVFVNAFGSALPGFPSGDYDFGVYWFFQPQTPISGLTPGNSYQLSWNWNDIRFGYPEYPPVTSDFDYSTVHVAVAQAQTINGHDFVLTPTVNGSGFAVTAAFDGDGDYNLFGILSADVPSEVNLAAFMGGWGDDGWAPVIVTGQYGSVATGTLDVQPVPLPPGLLLLSSGMAAILLRVRRKAF